MTKNIAIVYGIFHKEAAQKMLNAAREAAKTAGLNILKEVPVPGSFETPLAVKRLLLQEDIAGVAVLGVLEAGETSHGLVIAQSAFAAITQLQLEFMKPVGLGIIGPEVMPSQIESRLVPWAQGAVYAVEAMLK